MRFFAILCGGILFEMLFRRKSSKSNGHADVLPPQFQIKPAGSPQEKTF
jgi:hypothetical protein